jgi:hypothetical protein
MFRKTQQTEHLDMTLAILLECSLNLLGNRRDAEGGSQRERERERERVEYKARSSKYKAPRSNQALSARAIIYFFTSSRFGPHNTFPSAGSDRQRT